MDYITILGYVDTINGIVILAQMVLDTLAEYQHNTQLQKERRASLRACCNYLKLIQRSVYESNSLRHSEKRFKLCEKASADTKAAEEFADEFIELITSEQLSPEQIYNADETGLFWQYVPRNTLATSTEKLNESEGKDQDESSELPEGHEPDFPLADLARLDEMINRPRWVVPVLPKGELEVLLDAAINLSKLESANDTKPKKSNKKKIKITIPDDMPILIEMNDDVKSKYLMEAINKYGVEKVFTILTALKPSPAQSFDEERKRTRADELPDNKNTDKGWKTPKKTVKRPEKIKPMKIEQSNRFQILQIQTENLEAGASSEVLPPPIVLPNDECDWIERDEVFRKTVKMNMNLT
ncbi:putative ubiquitin carboxyl-terminal hydrolase FAF-X, partial [Stegodyphus mimosarum]